MRADSEFVFQHPNMWFTWFKAEKHLKVASLRTAVDAYFIVVYYGFVVFLINLEISVIYIIKCIKCAKKVFKVDCTKSSFSHRYTGRELISQCFWEHLYSKKILMYVFKV